MSRNCKRYLYNCFKTFFLPDQKGPYCKFVSDLDSVPFPDSNPYAGSGSGTFISVPVPNLTKGFRLESTTVL